MGLYVKGDVLLASVALDDRAAAKTRPVVVIATEEPGGRIHICPVSSKPPSDAPGHPLTMDDFVSGGLDLFSESYVMTSRVIILRPGDVIGKKGRLTAESLAEIAVSAPASGSSGAGRKTPGRRS